ncbi:hypothetical protein I79_005882 [Cricetulus griseus]|uniref:Uncharacterized protein n=1 Tax=Cricetulus griseus TaxID=10029 RepID=G3H6C7_CRIGR|nr:hypothetical protein I79_005882 [Cricetulus griseus]
MALSEKGLLCPAIEEIQFNPSIMQRANCSNTSTTSVLGRQGQEASGGLLRSQSN